MTMEIANPSEKNWLVKSSSRILGPFSKDEIAELLASRQISIIDEIRQPQGRWSYVRENQLFMDIVKAIRAEQDASIENTMTQSVGQYTSTKTDATSSSSDEITMTPPPAEPPALPHARVKDVTSTADRSMGGVRGASAGGKQKSFGAANDSRLKQRFQEVCSNFRWGIILLAGVVAASVFIVLNMRGHKKAAGYEDLLNQAIRYKSLGLYDKSLRSYKRAMEFKEPDADTQTQMAPVLISEDHQSLQGRRILERSLMREGRSREDMIDAYMGISVSYMMDGDLKEAEDTLQKAIGYDPSSLAALLNLAIVQMKKGDYSRAMREFESVYRKNPKSVMALLGRAMTAMEYAKSTEDRSFLNSLVSDIKATLQRTGFLHQELSLFWVYAANLNGDTDEVNKAVAQFLDSDLGSADNYVRPLFVDWRFTQWDYLEKYCSELYEKSVQTAEMKALRSVCLMQVNRDTEAQKILQIALSEGPKDPYVLATQAGYMNKVGHQTEAVTILKMPELTTLRVRSHMLGNICIASQDTTCAESVFTQAFQQNKNDVAALYGMAWVKMKRKDRAGAYDFVRSGLDAESNYIPLLELRDKLESE